MDGIHELLTNHLWGKHRVLTNHNVTGRKGAMYSVSYSDRPTIHHHLHQLISLRPIITAKRPISSLSNFNLSLVQPAGVKEESQYSGVGSEVDPYQILLNPKWIQESTIPYSKMETNLSRKPNPQLLHVRPCQFLVPFDPVQFRSQLSKPTG